jgi:HSP20 family protein
MAEVRVARTENPKYAAAPLFGTDLFRNNLFDMNPFRLMRRFGDEMERAFGKTETGAMWRPAIEVKRDNEKLFVRAELPGLNREDVKVTLTGDLLEIEGERKFEKEEKHEGYIHTERNYGRFYRAVPMPEGANAGKAVAEFANGILEIVIPVPKAAPAATEIPVTEAKKAAVAEIKH